MCKKNQTLGQQQEKIESLERELVLLRKVASRKTSLCMFEDIFGKRKLVSRVLTYLTVSDNFNLAATSRVIRQQMTLSDTRLKALVEFKDTQMRTLRLQVEKTVGKIQVTRPLHDFHSQRL